MRDRGLVRLALMSAVMWTSACSLYFNGDGDPPLWDAGPAVPYDGQDEYPDAARYFIARCEGGALSMLDYTGGPGDEPGHNAGSVIFLGRCEGECRSAAMFVAGTTRSELDPLCKAPASTGKECQLEGSPCSGSATIDCPQTTTCGYSVEGPTCTCSSSGSYQCTPRTETAAVQAAIVGKWRGRVTPPDFASPYDVSLWIYPDGTYWAECVGALSCNAFYYGSDGPHPWRKISVLSSSPTAGAWADIGVFKSSITGAISSLVVTNTTLAFTYNASWLNCGQPFFFNLTRE